MVRTWGRTSIRLLLSPVPLICPASVRYRRRAATLGAWMRKTPLENKLDTEKLRTNERKWTPSLMKAGWTAIPSILIEKQATLGLDPMDMNIIIHLSLYWWTSDNLPRPSVGTIAEAMGVTRRAVQKRIKSLEEVGFVRRIERRNGKNGSLANAYDLVGLIEHLQPYAEEKISEVKEIQNLKNKRIERKKPKT